MSITVIDTELIEIHTYVRKIVFEGAAPVLLERNYSHGGKEFIPDTAHSKWNHGEPAKTITVSGGVLKKDRTIGEQRAQLTYITPANQWWGQRRSFTDPEAPAWLLELFDIEVPE